MFLAEPSEYILFAVVSILISFSLVPLTLSKAKQPDTISSEHLSFKKLFSISPLATIGCVSVGLTSGAFWGLGAMYFTQIGLSAEQVATLISLTFLGGLMFQWPIGLCSDYFDRRKVISIALLCLTVVAFCFAFFVSDVSTMSAPLMVLSFLLGGFAYTLYSLFIALANDYLPPKFVVKASGGLIIFHAFGAIIGPIVASIFMSIMGPSGLFFYMFGIIMVVFLFSVMRIFTGRAIPEETSDHFISMPKTSMAIVDLDPRQEYRESELSKEEEKLN